MSNQYGRRCPKCGSGDAIVVNAVIYVSILLGEKKDTFFGAGESEFDANEVIWERDSDCWCNECQWNGTYKELLHD